MRGFELFDHHLSEGFIIHRKYIIAEYCRYFFYGFVAKGVAGTLVAALDRYLDRDDSG